MDLIKIKFTINNFMVKIRDHILINFIVQFHHLVKIKRKEIIIIINKIILVLNILIINLNIKCQDIQHLQKLLQ